MLAVLLASCTSGHTSSSEHTGAVQQGLTLDGPRSGTSSSSSTSGGMGSSACTWPGADILGPSALTAPPVADGIVYDPTDGSAFTELPLGAVAGAAMIDAIASAKYTTDLGFGPGIFPSFMESVVLLADGSYAFRGGIGEVVYNPGLASIADGTVLYYLPTDGSHTVLTTNNVDTVAIVDLDTGVRRVFKWTAGSSGVAEKWPVVTTPGSNKRFGLSEEWTNFVLNFKVERDGNGRVSKLVRGPTSLATFGYDPSSASSLTVTSITDYDGTVATPIYESGKFVGMTSDGDPLDLRVAWVSGTLRLDVISISGHPLRTFGYNADGTLASVRGGDRRGVAIACAKVAASSLTELMSLQGRTPGVDVDDSTNVITRAGFILPVGATTPIFTETPQRFIYKTFSEPLLAAWITNGSQGSYVFRQIDPNERYPRISAELLDVLPSLTDNKSMSWFASRTVPPKFGSTTLLANAPAFVTLVNAKSGVGCSSPCDPTSTTAGPEFESLVVGYGSNLDPIRATTTSPSAVSGSHTEVVTATPGTQTQIPTNPNVAFFVMPAVDASSGANNAVYFSDSQTQYSVQHSEGDAPGNFTRSVTCMLDSFGVPGRCTLTENKIDGALLTDVRLDGVGRITSVTRDGLLVYTRTGKDSDSTVTDQFGGIYKQMTSLTATSSSFTRGSASVSSSAKFNVTGGVLLGLSDVDNTVNGTRFVNGANTQSPDGKTSTTNRVNWVETDTMASELAH